MESTDNLSGKKVVGSILFLSCCLGISLMLCLGLLCGALFLVQSRTSASLPALLLPTPTLDLACESYDCLQVCQQQLPDMINPSTPNRLDEASTPESQVDIARYKVSEDRLSLKLLALPPVTGDLKSLQLDRDLHQRIWKYYRQIFPETQMVQVTYVVFFTDGQHQTTAYLRELGHQWHLYIDLLDFNNQYDTTETLIHEYGHLLTLNDSQATDPQWHSFRGWTRKDFDELRKTCSGFFSGSLCAYSGSYLNQFGQHFWTESLYDEWVETVFLPRATGPGDPDELVTKFYELHPDQFVSEYAASRPTEDLAESWVAFILQPKPAGQTIAEQKILFFYAFDDLLEIRAKIIRGICNYAAQGIK